jgi:DNA-binding NarL/FixJ family response regulator
VSDTVHNDPGSSGIPARILVAGADVLASLLAGAFAAHGFAVKVVVPTVSGLHCGITWRPNLVLIDVRSLDSASGGVWLRELRLAGLRGCVIDTSDDAERLTVWKRAGASALIDTREPIDQLFWTVNRLLRLGPAGQPIPRSSASLAVTYASDQPQEPNLERFAGLTERERVVLSELIEGHRAEQIAKDAAVSISTVRSQIKAILQKLGVDSQLAAVALARRAGWSAERTSPPWSRSAGTGRARVG